MPRPNVKAGYNLGKAAQIIGASVPALRKWINKGKIPGARRTAGGHRWIPREALLAFMQERGLPADHLKQADRRRHARIVPRRGRISLEAFLSGREELVGRGLGVLKDVSRSGFQVGDLRWEGDCVPAPGASFSFYVERSGLKGVAGTGRVAWLSGGRGEAGISLGAEVSGIETNKAVWSKYTAREIN